jgi:hypothetical protein
MSDAALPEGWENRNHELSEHDMKHGGMAANKFANKSAYGEDPTATYKTSDQVREFYLNKAHHGDDGEGDDIDQQAGPASHLPASWGARQKGQDAQAEHNESVAAPSNPPPPPAPAAASSSGSAEVALVHVATHTLNTLAATLEQHPASIPINDRHAFAEAMKRAMNAMAKSA